MAARAARPAKRVATPKLAADERRHGRPDEFGALSLYLVLASRLDPELSLRAAQGWGGDRYVGFTKQGADGRECLRISITGDTRADTARARRRVLAVGGHAAGRRRQPRRVGDRVDVTACDTGSTSAPDEATLDAAVTLLVDRNDIALELLRGAQHTALARCAADTLAADPTLVALLDESKFTPEQQDQFTTPSRRPCPPAAPPEPRCPTRGCVTWRAGRARATQPRTERGALVLHLGLEGVEAELAEHVGHVRDLRDLVRVVRVDRRRPDRGTGAARSSRCTRPCPARSSCTPSSWRRAASASRCTR